MNESRSTYRIRVKGILNPSLIGWLENITVVPHEPGETELVGSFVDQSALRGLLDQLWNLNIAIISVEEIGNEPDQARRTE